MVKAYLSIGTNIGKRVENLQQALQILQQNSSINLSKVSSVYETDPVGYTYQEQFLNIVVEVETTLTPEELLDYCLSSENELGRVREFKWGPRKIDIDLLLYEGEKRNTETLTIPHPQMAKRAFVLIPLAEIAPFEAREHMDAKAVTDQGITKTGIFLNW